jgi:ABC-2 type transport system permease protein
MMRRLKSRIFWIGLIFGLLGILAIIKFPAFLNSTYLSQSKQVVLAGDPALTSRAKPLIKDDFTVMATRTSTEAPTPEYLRSSKAAGEIALTQSNHRLNVTVYAKDPSSFDTSQLRHDLQPLSLQLGTNLPTNRVQTLLTVPIHMRPVASKFGTAAQADAARVIAYLLLVFLYVLIVINSQLIMSSVAEEKTSRIAELLIASVNPSSLLAGKIAASATLALLQMAIWVSAAMLVGGHPVAAPANPDLASGNSSPDFSLSGVTPVDIAGFAIFFILGFLQMSTLFAAIGSLINRTEDLGSLSGPLFIPVIAAFFIALSALAAPDTPVVIAASFIPLMSPFVMFARIVVTDVPIWQIVVSIVINVATIWAIAVLGGKIYRVGMLLYGRPPKFGQILSVLRSN